MINELGHVTDAANTLIGGVGHVTKETSTLVGGVGHVTNHLSTKVWADEAVVSGCVETYVRQGKKGLVWAEGFLRLAAVSLHSVTKAKSCHETPDARHSLPEQNLNTHLSNLSDLMYV